MAAATGAEPAGAGEGRQHGLRLADGGEHRAAILETPVVWVGRPLAPGLLIASEGVPSKIEPFGFEPDVERLIEKTLAKKAKEAEERAKRAARRVAKRAQAPKQP